MADDADADRESAGSVAGGESGPPDAYGERMAASERRCEALQRRVDALEGSLVERVRQVQSEEGGEAKRILDQVRAREANVINAMRNIERASGLLSDSLRNQTKAQKDLGAVREEVEELKAAVCNLENELTGKLAEDRILGGLRVSMQQVVTDELFGIIEEHKRLSKRVNEQEATLASAVHGLEESREVVLPLFRAHDAQISALELRCAELQSKAAHATRRGDAQTDKLQSIEDRLGHISGIAVQAVSADPSGERDPALGTVLSGRDDRLAAVEKRVDDLAAGVAGPGQDGGAAQLQTRLTDLSDAVARLENLERAIESGAPQPADNLQDHPVIAGILARLGSAAPGTAGQPQADPARDDLRDHPVIRDICSKLSALEPLLSGAEVAQPPKAAEQRPEALGERKSSATGGSQAGGAESLLQRVEEVENARKAEKVPPAGDEAGHHPSELLLKRVDELEAALKEKSDHGIPAGDQAPPAVLKRIEDLENALKEQSGQLIPAGDPASPAVLKRIADLENALKEQSGQLIPTGDQASPAVLKRIEDLENALKKQPEHTEDQAPPGLLKRVEELETVLKGGRERSLEREGSVSVNDEKFVSLERDVRRNRDDVLRLTLDGKPRNDAIVTAAFSSPDRTRDHLILRQLAEVKDTLRVLEETASLVEEENNDRFATLTTRVDVLVGRGKQVASELVMVTPPSTPSDDAPRRGENMEATMTRMLTNVSDKAGVQEAQFAAIGSLHDAVSSLEAVLSMTADAVEGLPELDEKVRELQASVAKWKGGGTTAAANGVPESVSLQLEAHEKKLSKAFDQLSALAEWLREVSLAVSDVAENPVRQPSPIPLSQRSASQQSRFLSPVPAQDGDPNDPVFKSRRPAPPEAHLVLPFDHNPGAPDPPGDTSPPTPLQPPSFPATTDPQHHHHAQTDADTPEAHVLVPIVRRAAKSQSPHVVGQAPAEGDGGKPRRDVDPVTILPHFSSSTKHAHSPRSDASAGPSGPQPRLPSSPTVTDMEREHGAGHLVEVSPGDPPLSDTGRGGGGGGAFEKVPGGGALLAEAARWRAEEQRAATRVFSARPHPMDETLPVASHPPSVGSESHQGESQRRGRSAEHEFGDVVRSSPVGEPMWQGVRSSPMPPVAEFTGLAKEYGKLRVLSTTGGRCKSGSPPDSFPPQGAPPSSANSQTPPPREAPALSARLPNVSPRRRASANSARFPESAAARRAPESESEPTTPLQQLALEEFEGRAALDEQQLPPPWAAPGGAGAVLDASTPRARVQPDGRRPMRTSPARSRLLSGQPRAPSNPHQAWRDYQVSRLLPRQQTPARAVSPADLRSPSHFEELLLLHSEPQLADTKVELRAVRGSRRQLEEELAQTCTQMAKIQQAFRALSEKQRLASESSPRIDKQLNTDRSPTSAYLKTELSKVVADIAAAKRNIVEREKRLADQSSTLRATIAAKRQQEDELKQAVRRLEQLAVVARDRDRSLTASGQSPHRPDSPI
ncbi:hypothetical protein DIPPA_16318 [Diplonema papillatum]|nr:hypothetical protein DIPPA_16318 [Diplonema papillatum]